jgi:multiple sugar transport system permease protein/putative aldouronate transport system permease protein
MWNRKIWYRFVIITMYFNAGLIPVYMNIKILGLMNSFWVYVIPGIFPVFNMVLVKTFVESISPAMEESAQIDGAGYYKCFFYIILPLSIPILATVALFSAVGQWNSWFDTLLYISNYKLFTLQYLLREYFNQAEKVLQLQESGMTITGKDIEKIITPTAVRLTITVVVTFPIMCVYPFIQRYYIKGVMVGAVKG